MNGVAVLVIRALMLGSLGAEEPIQDHAHFTIDWGTIILSLIGFLSLLVTTVGGYLGMRYRASSETTVRAAFRDESGKYRLPPRRRDG